MRELLVKKTIELLYRHRYSVSTYLHLNNCFDIAAKKGSRIVLLKILENIDALREEQAEELKRLGNAFRALVFVVGEKSKAFRLKPEIVYERYAVSCISIETLGRVLENEFPETKYFKGKLTVALDTQKFRKKRQELGFSLEQIAKKINSTPESVHRYETKGSTSLETAKKLEKALGESLVQKIDFLKPQTSEAPKHPHEIDSAFEKIEKLGFKLDFFSHAPFKAYSHPEELIYFNYSKRPLETKRKALDMRLTEKIIGGLPLIIAKTPEKETKNSVPVISEEELLSMSKKANLIEVARERKKNGKRK